MHQFFFLVIVYEVNTERLYYTKFFFYDISYFFKKKTVQKPRIIITLEQL